MMALIFFFFAIHYFHKDHNAPQKFCIAIVSNFSWVLQSVPREIEVIGYAKIWGVNKVHYGLCENGEFTARVGNIPYSLRHHYAV